jgi:hypothetical protein
MCPAPKREVDVKLTYQGIILGFVHYECLHHVIKADAQTRMRSEGNYNIWSLPKETAEGRKIKYSDPCLNSFNLEPPVEEAGV